MQSIFRLPWCSDQLGSKMTEDNIVLEKMRNMPVVEIPIFHKLKRKFSDTVDAVTPFPAPSPKKARPEADTDAANRRPLLRATPGNDSLAPEVTTTTAIVDNTVPSHGHKAQLSSLPPLYDPARMQLCDDASYLPSTLTPVQQTIEHQFNMQILMKHNELRLIEQELAKCQIALEQLRRCEVRPYPGNDQPALSVSEGRGPAVLPPAGYTRPSHPSPYGVTDGPYSRHYQQWLLRDESFDSVPFGAISPFTDSPIHASARSTRGAVPARKSISKTTSMSTRHTEAQHALPNYPAAPARDKSAPLVLRRSTDGQLVKLICNNCHRGNFSSIQGFLNHCRIAHKVDYKSHDLAAIDCGQLLDEHEMATLPASNSVAAAAPSKPAVSKPITVAVTPARGNLVHPLNSPGTNVTVPKSKIHRTTAQPVRDLVSARPHGATETQLKPSDQVPRLSRLFAKHNFGGDLEKAAAIARQRIDFSRDELHSPDSSEQNSPITFNAGAHPCTTPSTTHRPQSRKGYRQPAAARPRPAPLVPPTTSAHHDVDNLYCSAPPSAAPSSAAFSPDTVADSNPGLVSDHDDDDHDASASEGESSISVHVASNGAHHHPHHHHHHIGGAPPNGGRTCGADHIEIEVDDDVVGDETPAGLTSNGVIIRRTSGFAGADTSRAALVGRGAATGSPGRKMGHAKGGSK